MTLTNLQTEYLYLLQSTFTDNERILILFSWLISSFGELIKVFDIKPEVERKKWGQC